VRSPSTPAHLAASRRALREHPSRTPHSQEILYGLRRPLWLCFAGARSQTASKRLLSVGAAPLLRAAIETAGSADVETIRLCPAPSSGNASYWVAPKRSVGLN